MANINNRVKLWRGTRANYNALGTWDYWTEYNVKEENGTWTKYYGTKEVVGDSGELAPVEGVLSPAEFNSLNSSGKTQGSRWLVGSGDSYYVVEFGPNASIEAAKIQPLGNYSVRVKDRGLKAYELVDGELYTYDVEFSSGNTPSTGQTLDEINFEEENGVIRGSVILDNELDENSSHAITNGAITSVIYEDERITAAALNDLNTNKADKDYVDGELSGITAVLEEKADITYVDELVSSITITVDDELDSASTNPVENKVLYQVITEDERITSAALNNLNERKADKDYVDGELSGITIELAEKADITYVDELVSSITITVDDELDSASTNPVENRVIYQVIADDEEAIAIAIGELDERKTDKDYVDAAISSITIDVDSQLDSASTNPVENRVIYNAIQPFITKSVNDLTNYYLKTETYTQTEVNNLIGAINQFRYEIDASTSAVTDPQPNVLYLIGPMGSGSDMYEEYVYANSAWTKIGDTSIDLTDYVTIQDLNDALADYTLSVDIPFENGEGLNSAKLKNGNLTVFGANSVAEGTSTTLATERGITTASTVQEIVTEWAGSTPESDKFTLVTGEGAHAEGNNGLALGDHSHVEGNGCIADNNSSHAEGTGTIASGAGAHAEGKGAVNKGAIGDYSHAEGNSTTASGRASHAEGSNTTARGASSHAEGADTTASGNYSHAEGNNTTASGYRSHTEGERTAASGNNSHAEGYHTKANGINSHAEGAGTIASGNGSHAEGVEYNEIGTSARADAAHAEGAGVVVKGQAAHGEGLLNVAGRTQEEAVAALADFPNLGGTTEQKVSKLIGFASHSEGSSTQALGTGSHAEGNSTQALVNSTHAEGDTTTASGEAAHSEGYKTTASGNQSHSEGFNTQATANQAHSEGKKTIASAENAHSEGNETKAVGNASHSEGYRTYAYGAMSHIEGTSSTLVSDANAASESVESIWEENGHNFSLSRGQGSHVEGKNCLATGDWSHAEGVSSSATKIGSHAEGWETRTSNDCEHAEGQWNVSHAGSSSSAKTMHSVGIGTANNDRKNAFEIMKNGDTYLYGVGNYSGNSISNVDTLQDVINDKADISYVDAAISSITFDVDSQLDSASTNPVENKAIFKVIADNEKVTAAALNDLTDTKADKDYVDSELSGITTDLAGKADISYVDSVVSAVTADVVDCAATIDVNDTASTVVAVVDEQNITLKVEMGSLTIAGANGLANGITFDGTSDIEILTLDCGEY